VVYSSTLKVEAVCCSETSVEIHRTKWRYVPEDRTLLTLVRFLNLKRKALLPAGMRTFDTEMFTLFYSSPDIIEVIRSRRLI
jgi:hypothetical protein